MDKGMASPELHSVCVWIQQKLPSWMLKRKRKGDKHGGEVKDNDYDFVARIGKSKHLQCNLPEDHKY
jgi:hypothetical protein